MNTQKEIRAVVRGAYDIQDLRMRTGLRLVSTFKAKLGQAPSEKEDEMTPEGQEILRNIRDNYRTVTQGLMNKRIAKSSFVGEGLIDSFSEYILVSNYMTLEEAEEKAFKHLSTLLKDVPIYKHFLKDVRGIGPAMAGVIISEIDISRAKYASSLTRLAGIDVAEDGKGRSRKAEHLVDVEYTKANGEKATKKSITFNPFLKTKLVGVLGTSFIRCGEGKYRTLYVNYKNRLDNHVHHREKSKMHKHRMAVRYMLRIFLQDLYAAWRPLEGLEVFPPYQVAKLGLSAHND